MTVSIRDTSYTTYVGGSQTWASEPGDLAVIIAASQYGTTNAHAPSGWTEIHTGAGVARAGYIAYKRVESSSDTTGIDMLAGAEGDAARLRARGLSLAGVQEFDVIGWQAEKPTVTGQTLLASQRHGAAGTGAGIWDVAASVVGEYSEEASWSVLLTDLVSSDVTPVQGQEPQMWCAIVFSDTPSEDVVTKRFTSTGPAVTRIVPHGAASVQSLFSGSQPAMIAHRGAAANFPEGSAAGYTGSVVHGAPALEVSCHMTSDGVWFVCHDATLQRIDPSAPSTDVREMTWEEVSQYTTMGAPIVRLEEITEAYADTHVLFLDPKNSALNWRSMVDGLDKSRVVLKFSGDASWLAQQWKAEGWTTWGYYYDTSIDETWFQDSLTYWDYIGVPIGTSRLSDFQATGKPMIAHIAYNAEDITAAKALPVVAVMCSDITEALPLQAPASGSESGSSVPEEATMPLWCYMAAGWTTLTAGGEAYVNLNPTTAVDTSTWGGTMVALGSAVQGQTSGTPYDVTGVITYISSSYAVMYLKNSGSESKVVRPRLLATSYNYLYH